MQPNEPAGCLSVIFRLFGTAPQAPEQLPYARKDFLLSKAERSFFGVLQQAIRSELLVFAKVRLADLLYIKKGTEKRQSYFNRIKSKHIDFVLCEPAEVRPLLAIELDDSSHQRTNRKERDVFVDEALAAAGLPILRVTAKRSYKPNELVELINERLSSEEGDT